MSCRGIGCFLRMMDPFCIALPAPATCQCTIGLVLRLFLAPLLAAGVLAFPLLTWGQAYCPRDDGGKALTKVVVAQIAEADDQFRFTSIQLNHSLRAKLHVDDSNWGPSYAISLGPFLLGNL